MQQHKWFLEVNFPPPNFQLKTGDHLLTWGSCFAQAFGNYFENLGWPIHTNPLGISYNPVSISHFFDLIRHSSIDNHKNWVSSNQRWYHYDFHSEFNFANINEGVDQLNQNLTALKNELKSTEVHVITLGSAHVFRLKSTGHFVNNCHKQNANLFSRIQLSLADCSSALKNIYDQIKAYNPNAKIIWTVSPIRHLRLGLLSNTRSKACLHLAVQNQLQKGEDQYYFPSYEIVMDELRDYRFYKTDRLHLTQEAEQFVMQKFTDIMFDEEAQKVLELLKQYYRMVNHKVKDAQSTAGLTFIEKKVSLYNQLKQKYAWLQLEQPS